MVLKQATPKDTAEDRVDPRHSEQKVSQVAQHQRDERSSRSMHVVFHDDLHAQT